MGLVRYNPNIHHRHSTRLKGYDYSREGLYFITVCIQNRECLLGEISNGEMILNEYGETVQKVWNELPRHYMNIQLGEFIVMPNHIHGIIIINNDDNNDGGGNVGAGFKLAPTATATKKHGLPEIVRALKTFSAKQINKIRNTAGEKVWQRNYYEHIIRNANAHHKIAAYILDNPAKWLNDKFYMQ